MVDVVKELEALRQNLLDPSLQNNLLNYRPSQKRTLSVAGRKLEEIYELFVLQEKSMRFRAKARSRKNRKTENEEEDEASEKESRLLKSIEKILVSENKPQSSRYEPFLETPDDSETLDKKLFYVFNQAKSKIELNIPKIKEPAVWAEPISRSPAGKFSSYPANPILPIVSALPAVSVASKGGEELEIKAFETEPISEAFEAELRPETSFEAEIKESYSGAFFKLGEGLTDHSDTDFLPEMDLKAESMVLVADKNSRKKL